MGKAVADLRSFYCPGSEPNQRSSSPMAGNACHPSSARRRHQPSRSILQKGECVAPARSQTAEPQHVKLSPVEAQPIPSGITRPDPNDHSAEPSHRKSEPGNDILHLPAQYTPRQSALAKMQRAPHRTPNARAPSPSSPARRSPPPQHSITSNPPVPPM